MSALWEWRTLVVVAGSLAKPFASTNYDFEKTPVSVRRHEYARFDEF